MKAGSVETHLALILKAAPCQVHSSSAVRFCFVLWACINYSDGFWGHVAHSLSYKNNAGGKLKVQCMCPLESQWSEGPSDERVSCGFHLLNMFWWGWISLQPSQKKKKKKKTASYYGTIFFTVAHTYFWFLNVTCGFGKTHFLANKRLYFMCLCTSICELYLDDKCSAEPLSYVGMWHRPRLCYIGFIWL